MGQELQLVVRSQAEKDLARLSYVDRDRIVRRIEAYAANPRDPRHDVIPLVGTLSGYRLHVGNWRVLFALVDSRMEVTRVMHRKEAYR